MPKKDKSFNPNSCKKLAPILINDLLIVPFEGGTFETQKLFSYFLHNAPNVESAHSKKIPINKHTDIFERMMRDRHFYYQRFCASNAVIENELIKGCLNGINLCFKCKRFVCKKKQSKKELPSETDLNCFLRHIRNAIAHGRVYYCHGGNKINIVFEDMNDSGNLSARIVCIKADLEHWKKVLSDSRNYD